MTSIPMNFIHHMRDKVVLVLREKRATITNQVVTGARISDFPDYKHCVGHIKGLDEAIQLVQAEFDKLLNEGDE